MMRFTLVCFLAISSALSTFAQKGNLVVFSGTNELFTLSMNGVRINAQPGSHVKVQGVPAATYDVVIKFNNPSLPQIRQQVPLKGDRELTLSATKLVNGAYALIFVNEFSLMTAFAPVGEQMVLPFSSVVVTDQVIQAEKPAQLPAVAPKPVPVTPEKEAAAVKEPGVKEVAAEKPEAAKPPVIEQPAVVVPVSHEPSPMPGYSGPTGCENPMESRAFEGMKAKIQAAKHSTTRMTTAKQLSDPECLLTTQVVEVMDLFTFDSDKVEFAKYAYTHTYDKGNYYKVKEAVVFAGSMDELAKFLEGK